MSGFCDLPPEDQEALRQLVSRRGMTWAQFRFLTELIVRIPRDEESDDRIMRRCTTQRLVGNLEHH